MLAARKQSNIRHCAKQSLQRSRTGTLVSKIAPSYEKTTSTRGLKSEDFGVFKICWELLRQTFEKECEK
ncbi:MAG: hypothetical protein C0507_12185 [Cyanobacteria bacterium PR.3.49]|nr:hypothetical protein [Cyanobacteria bacterium PR.3.49]